MDGTLDTKHDAIVVKYFDLVQDEIKKLFIKDGVPKNKVQNMNDEMFSQDDDINYKIKEYIEDAASNGLDFKRIAKTLFDKFEIQMKNNFLYQNDKMDVPNELMDEKFIITFDKFKNRK